ncbi:MAG TPA: flagellar protein FliT [Rhodocyclaceae bacterium]|nr:flagellar protein FliT [Rhodocyclaceae bacterium]HRQ45334.1 flagellar protein FliT [Rhodocyclaceae bacterium]
MKSEVSKVAAGLPRKGPPDFDSRLFHLTEGLRALLTAAQAADWERVTAISARLGPALEAVRGTPPGNDRDVAQRRRQMEEALSLLERVLEVCSTRREQIHPLVSALDKIAEKSTER